MEIKSIKQPAKPKDFKTAPDILNPVEVTLSCPIYVWTSQGAQLVKKPIVCSQLFAETILTEQEYWSNKYNLQIVHIGILVVRYARHKDGTPILPLRPSNHSKGNAEDWKGVLYQGDFMDIDDMKKGIPNKYSELLNKCKNSLLRHHLQTEIVDEGGWIHLGFF